MKNNREDTIVVFAGYPDQMKDFFDRNPGLRSRVPFTVHFDDYSTDEMTEIVELEAEKRGFRIAEEAMEKVRYAIWLPKILKLETDVYAEILSKERSLSTQ